METIKKRYRIWRAVQVYIGVILQAPGRSLIRLFVLALVDVALAVVPPSIDVSNPLAALFLSQIWSIVALIALMLYLTSFTSELLQSLNKTVIRQKKYLLGLTVVAIIASICRLALVMITRSFFADSRPIRLLLELLIFSIYVPITIAAIFIVQGSRPLRSIWKSIGFVFDNIGKMVVFLMIAVVLVYGLIAITYAAINEGFYRTQILSFSSFFAPALFLPVVCVMYVKVEYFPDPISPPRYLKLG